MVEKKLNLGSFIRPLPGFVNVDREPWDGVDKICDLNVLPWPFKDEEFDQVRAVDVIEHLGGLSKWEIVGEIARITKKGGRVTIGVPNGFHHVALACLQHAHWFWLTSFDPSYSQPWFTLLRIETSWLPYRFPFRKFLRLMTRLHFVEELTFTLEKRNVIIPLLESGDK